MLEFPLVRFLERYGYDVSYTTDVDTDAKPAELVRHRLIIVAGHDEYWTKAIRDAFEQARDAGTNLAFLGANIGYWQARYAAGRRTLVEYRKSTSDPEPDPALKTTLFRWLTPPRPECQLLGVESTDDRPGNQSIGVADYSLGTGALGHAWLTNTGFTAATSFRNLVGYEWDLITPGCQSPPLTDLFHYAGQVPADGVTYTAASGARVFSAGTLRFAWALDPSRVAGDPGATNENQGLVRFMRNALDDLTRPAAPTGIAARRASGGVRVFFRRHPDPRTRMVVVYAHAGRTGFVVPGPGLRLVCMTAGTTCLDRKATRRAPARYAAISRDRWRSSAPVISQVVGSSPGQTGPATIQSENRLPGTSSWLLPQASGRSIEGYTSQASVAPGDRLQLHVSTVPAARYRVEVFRLGWYQGAGARLLACLPICSRDEPGAPQPVPPPDPETGMIADDWPVTDQLTIPASWVSGYYLLDLVLTSGTNSGDAASVPLIVREPASADSSILLVAPVDTWQAYNVWGGKSLYGSRIGDPKSYAREVSFDRPYDPTSSPLQSSLYWEYPLVRFLERYGYDVSYTTDVDVDQNPSELSRHRLVIIAGHSEYWTKGIFDAYQAARDAGTNLAFLGGNDGYWQIRYADDRRSIVEWRSAGLDPDPDATEKTVRFRDLRPPRPECQLTGLEWQGGWRRPPGTPPAAGESTTGTTASPDYTVDPAALTDPWFRNTGFTAGATLPRMAGYEWDAIVPGCAPANLTVLFHYQGIPSPANRPPFETSFLSTNADIVRYTAPSGARVLSTGSIQFSWALDDFARRLHAHYPANDTINPDTRLQRLLRNALDDLTRPR
jgi:hypothetical protein